MIVKVNLLWIFALCYGFGGTAASTAAAAAAQQQTISVGELFTYKIQPTLFNWTTIHHVMNEQFRYRPSLHNYPDLPSWMRYMYSKEHQAGFLYGSPPDNTAGKTIHLDVVALNRQNYETKEIILSFFVAHKFPTTNIIQMKIDNLDWVHLMDPGRVEDLRNIFRKELWPESENDLSLTFMESAVNMGGRAPLKPQQREGVFVHLGSFAQFSPRLRELQAEVRPLYKLPSCSYKRTSVEKIFENAGFKLDWCAFKMVGAEISPEIISQSYHNHKTFSNSEFGNLKRNDKWESISRDEVPTRNYVDEFAFAFAIPGMIFAVLMAILSIALCFQHEKLEDRNSEFFFENIFHICEEAFEEAESQNSSVDESENVAAYPQGSTVQMVQYSDSSGNNQPITTLKSIKDSKNLLDNISFHSESPNSSFYHADNITSSAYQRPKPPPYKGRNGLENI